MAFLSPVTHHTLVFFQGDRATANRFFTDTQHNTASRFHPPARRRPIRCVANSEKSGQEKPSITSEKEARIQLWREVEALKKSLTIAVNAERFVDAARIRDQIESLTLADDYFRTDKELKTAIQEERYADAARLRDALKVLEPPPKMAVLTGDKNPDDTTRNAPSNPDLAALKPDDVSSSSTAVTQGISVHVESDYVAAQSIPEQNRFLFSYKVTIKNESNITCQLISRHWIITSAVGPPNEVKGSGVVGRQPVLEPGQTFQYTSACPISAPLSEGQSVLGSMHGTYNFCKGDTGNVKFDVDINPFYFKLPFRNFRPSGPSPPGFPWSKP